MKKTMTPNMDERHRAVFLLVEELTALTRLAVEDSGASFRLTTRVTFSMLEAVEYCLRQDLKGFTAIHKIPNPKRLKGAEVIFEFKKGQDGSSAGARHDLRARLRGCRQYFKELIREGHVPQSGFPKPLERLPSNLSLATDFRNRITHPKSVSSMQFGGEEAKSIKALLEWVASMITAMTSHTNYLPRVSLIFGTLMADIAGDGDWPDKPMAERNPSQGSTSGPPRLPGWVPPKER